MHDKKEITHTPKQKKLKVKSQIISEHLHLYICLSLHCTKLKHINNFVST